MIKNGCSRRVPLAARRGWNRCWLLAGLLGLGGNGCKLSEPPAGFQGVIEFEERVLGFELGGRVTELFVQRGDDVKAGATLATLDDSLERANRATRASEAETAAAGLDLLRSGSRREDIGAMAARVRAAQASEATIRKNLERERALLAKGVSTQAVVDDLEGQLERAIAERQSLEQQLSALRKGARPEEIKGAEARTEAARAALAQEDVRLARHNLTALSDGTVLDLHIEAGEVVASGTPVLTVADTTRPFTEVFVPEGQLGGIKLGARASVRVDSLPAPVTGKVEHIASQSEFTPRFLFSERERPNLVVRVRVRIDDPKRLLHSGTPAFVTIAGR